MPTKFAANRFANATLWRTRHGGFKFSSGADYEGDFVQGAFHGWGVYTYPDNSVFTGQFVKGQREGKGYMEMPTGDKYEGTWRNNEWDPSQGCPHASDISMRLNAAVQICDTLLACTGKPVYHQADGSTREL